MPLPEMSGAEPAHPVHHQIKQSIRGHVTSKAILLTVNGLVDAIALALAIRNAAQAGAGQQANAAWDDAGLVADDVAKQVTRDDDAVQAARVLDHDHGRAVDELVLHLEIRKLLLERLCHDLAPEPARRQHVGLVQRPHLGLAAAPRQEPGQTRHTLDLGARVRLRVPGVAVAVVLVALAKVDAARELAHDDKIGAAAHLGA